MNTGKLLAGSIILFHFFLWWIVFEITEYLDERKWKKIRNWKDNK